MGWISFSRQFGNDYPMHQPLLFSLPAASANAPQIGDLVAVRLLQCNNCIGSLYAISSSSSSNVSNAGHQLLASTGHNPVSSSIFPKCTYV